MADDQLPRRHHSAAIATAAGPRVASVFSGVIGARPALQHAQQIARIQPKRAWRITVPFWHSRWRWIKALNLYLSRAAFLYLARTCLELCKVMVRSSGSGFAAQRPACRAVLGSHAPANSANGPFLNDKLDLAQPKRFCDLIEASSEAGGAQRACISLQGRLFQSRTSTDRSPDYTANLVEKPRLISLKKKSTSSGRRHVCSRQLQSVAFRI